MLKTSFTRSGCSGHAQLTLEHLQVQSITFFFFFQSVSLFLRGTERGKTESSFNSIITLNAKNQMLEDGVERMNYKCEEI